MHYSVFLISHLFDWVNSHPHIFYIWLCPDNQNMFLIHYNIVHIIFCPLNSLWHLIHFLRSRIRARLLSIRGMMGTNVCVRRLQYLCVSVTLPYIRLPQHLKILIQSSPHEVHLTTSPTWYVLGTRVMNALVARFCSFGMS